MNLEAQNPRKLCHLTRNRPQSLGRRIPSKQHLRSSFNEQDYRDGTSQLPVLINKLESMASSGVHKKAPPPLVAKKPEVAKKPSVPAKPSNSNLEKPNLIKPSSAHNTFKDSLSKKLTLPTHPSHPAKLNQKLKFEHSVEVARSTNSDKNKNSLSRELNGIFSKQQHDTSNDYKRNYDNPKSDRTISLTEVSTLKTEDKSAKYMNDTLDMMTDEGFDTTNDEVPVNMHGDIELSPDEDDDELFAQFSIPPPPPPEMYFSDSEADFSFKEKGRKTSNISETGSCSSTESLSCAFECFVPPPPPPNLINDTDDEDVDLDDDNDDDDDELSFPGSIPEFDEGNETTETQIGFHEGNSTIKRKDSGVTVNKVPSIPDHQIVKQNLVVGELQSKLFKSSNERPYGVKGDEAISTSQKKDLGTPPINKKTLLQKNSYTKQTSKESESDDDFLPDHSFENTITAVNKDLIANKANPLISANFGGAAKELKNKNDNVLHELNKVNLNAVKNKKVFQESDSGHGTARSVEVSDSESLRKENSFKSKNKNSPKLMSREDSVSFQRKENSFKSNKNNITKSVLTEDSILLQRKDHRKASTTSKTWSSFSSSADEDNGEEKVNENQPKVNLRDLMKKMNTFDSDSEDDDVLEMERKTGDIEKRNMNEEDDRNSDSVHFSDSEVETHLNDLDVAEWTVDDVGEWLELIGVPHLIEKFSNKGIDGKALADLDTKLLEDMRINSYEDQELILSEVYALQNPGDVDLQVSMLDQLDKASGEEREKMLSLLTALQEPSNESFINSYMLSTKAGNGEYDNDKGASRQQVEEAPIGSMDDSVQYAQAPSSHANDQDKTMNLMQKLAADVFDPADEEEKDAKTTKVITSPVPEKLQKKQKKKGFFASLRRGKAKKKSNTASNPNDNAINNNSQGLVKVLFVPPGQTKEIEIPLLVSMKTSSSELCSMCLQFLHLDEDVKCYCIVISRIDRKVQNIDLNPDECPLMFQSKWEDLNTYQFELKCNSAGHIIVNSEDCSEEEMVSVKLGISSTTTAQDIVPVLLKRFKEKDDPTHYKLKQTDKNEYINDQVPLLQLPLSGYKFHVFKLINVTPSASKNTGRIPSFTEVKKMETKCSLLEKQIDGLTAQVKDLRKTEAGLLLENQNLKSDVTRLNETVGKKNEEIKQLHDEVTNMSLTERTRQLVSPTPDKELHFENANLNEELQKLKHQVSHLEQVNKSLKDSKTTLETDNEQNVQRCKSLEATNEKLKTKLEQLESERKFKNNDNGDQMKKLYAENKEHLKTIHSLEERLADVECKYSQLKMDKEADGAETSELRIREEALENQVLEKDSKLLEMEFKLQKKERTARELEEQLEDEKRRRKKEVEAKESFERRNEDLSLKLENTKQQLNEKEKQIQSAKNQINKQEKKLIRQKTVIEQERSVKEDEIQRTKKQLQSEITVLQEKVESLQKLHVEKNLNLKQKEFDLAKQNEDLQVAVTSLERKLSSKEIIIERLEEKVAKSNLSIESKLQEQMAAIQTKDEKIRDLDMEVARMETEHISKARETSSAIRMKESTISKLESRIKKLETSNKEGARKFEKFSSEKDRLLMQMNDDREKEMKDLKSRVRQQEENATEKESQMKELKKRNADMKKSYDKRLKKREKEYKQQKYLLEKMLELVNAKTPSLLRQLQEIIDDEQSSRNSRSGSRLDSDASTVEDEWC